MVVCGILSKHFDISPCTTQLYFDPFRYISNNAVWTDLPLLNPCEEAENLGSNIASRIPCTPFCTIFSLGVPIPIPLPPLCFARGRASGLNLPLALGISILRFGENLNFPDLSSFAVFSNHSQSIPSRVSLDNPFVIFPGLFISL